GSALVADLHEWAVPIPRPVRGRIRLHPTVVNARPIALDRDGQHHWTPIAPAARIEVELSAPRLRWSGGAYFDHNTGTKPLEQSFDHWFWSRASTRQGPVVLYELQERGDRHNALALHFDRSGQRHELPTPLATRLPRTRWRVERPVRADDGQAELLATWEDTPFYARSLMRARLLGERVTAVHESLSLRRFAAPWVQFMLPFRMPRRRK
ncbi:MAG: carotenoid 1,2-hydratase, partial [Wenzhouxiangellaceae bacterium]